MALTQGSVVVVIAPHLTEPTYTPRLSLVTSVTIASTDTVGGDSQKYQYLQTGSHNPCLHVRSKSLFARVRTHDANKSFYIKGGDMQLFAVQVHSKQVYSCTLGESERSDRVIDREAFRLETRHVGKYGRDQRSCRRCSCIFWHEQFYTQERTLPMDHKDVSAIERAKEAAAAGGAESASIADEVAKQLGDFADGKKVSAASSDGSILRSLDNHFSLGEKEKAEALKQVGKSLEAMVKGDIPQLRERMKELGISTKELDEVEKKLQAKVEAAKPVEEAILKGDIKGLQKMVSEMKPEQLTEITELVQKHFERIGVNIEVDFTDGKLILSNTKSDRAVLISKDKLDVIGVNPDGSYDFNRHFRRENPAAELKQLGDGALARYMFPPNYPIHRVPHIQFDQLQNSVLKQGSAAEIGRIVNKLK